MIPLPPSIPLPLPFPGFSSGLPVGALVAFAGEVEGQGSDPQHVTVVEAAGWMVCDGRALSVSAYPELFAALGYRYSKADSGDTFSIPDLRGYFLRGADPGGVNDPDAGTRTMTGGSTSAAVGSKQDCAFQLHEHDYAQAEAQSTPAEGGQAGVVTTQTAATSKVVAEPGGRAPLFTSAAETRPKNVAVYYLIKFTSGPAPWTAPLGRGFGG